jgi:predicted O-methyltransferase YrrM
MPELAVLIPTRGRPGNIRKVISAWDFTNAWDHADMVLIVDADDPEIEGYRDIDFEMIDQRPNLLIMTIPKWLPMVHKLDAAARDLAPRYFALGFAGDDHLPQTIGWAKRYLDVLHELQTGMVYGDDGYQGRKLSTEWAITSDVVRELGRMVPAPVEHMYCDNAMMDLFGAAGALRHLPEVRIEHMHPIVGKAETDAQYQRVNHRDQFKKDRTHYEVWRKVAMDVQVAAVRLLRGGLPETRPEQPPARQKSLGSAPRRVDLRPKGKSMRKLPVPRSLRKVKGATPDEIGLTLADFAINVPADEAIVEIGVYQGRTALLMAWGAQQGNGAHVWAIDPWEKTGNVYDPPFTLEGTRRWAEYNVKATGYSKHVTLVHDYSQNVSDRWNPGTDGRQIGLLFVDGDHTKEGAKRDILGWMPHLAPGAIIAVDDYHHPDWPGVAEALDELVAEGVLEPVEIFHDRLAVTRLTDPGEMKPGHDMTAITSEGVSPSPYPAAEGQVAVEPDDVDRLFDGPADTEVSTDSVKLTLTEAMEIRELEGVPSTATITDLNLTQLKALAKHRGIVLGARKDKKDLILQALREGK